MPNKTSVELDDDLAAARILARTHERNRADFPVDRGNGFFDAGTGAVTVGYSEALKEHGLRCFWKKDASAQHGELQEMMLHETAVAWVRYRLTKTRPKQAWTETLEDYHSRLKTCAAYINEHYNVEGLCNDFPTRLRDLDAAEGDRIRK